MYNVVYTLCIYKMLRIGAGDKVTAATCVGITLSVAEEERFLKNKFVDDGLYRHNTGTC